MTVDSHQLQHLVLVVGHRPTSPYEYARVRMPSVTDSMLDFVTAGVTRDNAFPTMIKRLNCAARPFITKTFCWVDVMNSKPGIRNPNLDMFDLSNGYPGDTAAGSPTFKSATYDDKFKRRFLDGQGNRNADLLQEAQSIWSDIQADKPELYPDNMPFIVPGADGAARLWQADRSLVNCTKNSQIFLTHTGTLNPSPGPICSVRIPSVVPQATIRSIQWRK